ncbi:MAG: putative integral rane protein [Acidobacteriaceae bacterium]|nr:putative integral rane protein [Acidobacteriaceae bacterium]
MPSAPIFFVRRLFGTGPGEGARTSLIARWLFLRGLGLIYFSAFFSLFFQIRGLIGPQGILPAGEYLEQVARHLGSLRLWYAPTVLWLSSGGTMLTALSVVGMIASVLLVLNLWPRLMLLVCFVAFLSFVSAAQDFSSYQSDGMLLEAGFISLLLAPRGLRPGWGADSPPPLAAVLLLLWEWFRIYFESGAVKLLSGDPSWRNLTAMDEYYQNGPLPTWVGWYMQHLPEWFHKATAGATLLMELVLVFMAFLPRPWRIACFVIVTVWQAGVIVTANYTFLNYLVLLLGILLLDDALLQRFLPAPLRRSFPQPDGTVSMTEPRPTALPSRSEQTSTTDASDQREQAPQTAPPARLPRWQIAASARRHLAALRLALTAVLLSWVFYNTFFLLLHMFSRNLPLPAAPVVALEPFRIANQYGLFAVMTPHRYEIEFQGSNDGATWVAYPFRYKPQDVSKRPRIYAPYQPRFDWNLWFASLGSWPQYPFVPRTEELLLTNSHDVLGLFAGSPFPNAPPRYVRAVLWQYWFTSLQEKRATGHWWRRQFLGTYAPTIERTPDGRFAILQDATLSGPPQ